MNCEKCGIEQNGLYGSGRFCSSKCARSFSTIAKRKEINVKISKIIKEKLSKGIMIGCVKRSDDNVIKSNCDICGKGYITRTYEKRGRYRKTCSNECSIKLRTKTYSENKTKIVGGYRMGSGKGKSGWYKGYWCDSTYELAFVIYNIDHGINFIRNTEGFKYSFDGKIHTYYPDFIIDEHYYEIKGFETKQDFAKYLSIPKPLVILRKKDLKEIFLYVTTTYGDDYVRLYEGNPHNKLTNTCKVCGSACKSKNIYCSRKCSGKGNNKNSKWKNLK
jgi:hypothetical protein